MAIVRGSFWAVTTLAFSSFQAGRRLSYQAPQFPPAASSSAWMLARVLAIASLRAAAGLAGSAACDKPQERKQAMTVCRNFTVDSPALHSKAGGPNHPGHPPAACSESVARLFSVESAS